MKSRRAIWIFVVLLIFVTGLGVWLSREGSTGSPGHPLSTGPSRESQSETAQATASASAPPPVTAIGATSIVRGPNNQLVFQDARPVKRTAVAEKVFAEELLQLSNGPATGPLSRNEHTTSVVEAGFSPDTVQRLIHSNAGAFRLPLDAQRSVVVDIEKVITRGEVSNSIIGKVRGDPRSEVLLVFHDGVVSGSVAFYDTNEHFDFGTAGNGQVAIRRLDPKTFTALCGHPGGADHVHESEEAPGGSPPAVDLPTASEALEELIVMDTVVGYGQQARIAEGGVAAMEAKIMVSVDRMNTAFSNSQIAGVSVSLRGTIEDPDYVFPGETAGEMGSVDELGDLDSTNDGRLDTVTDLRTALGADTAAFVVKQVDGSAGIAYRPGRSMVVARDYMSSTRITYAHEFGHNIGCQHAWGDTSSATNRSLNNYGWRFDPPNSGKVRTIMAYDWDWTRVPYFSNPQVLYNGAKTGAVDGYNATGDATADPRAVSGGDTGSAGSGYDGTHPNLGAQNAEYIMANAYAVADNADRPEPEIEVEQPTGTDVLDNALRSFYSPAIGTPTVLTFTIRNTGTADLTGLVITKDGANSSEFVVGPLASPTLAAGTSTTFDVTFTPTVYADRTAALHIASNDSDENPFDINLSGGVWVEITSDSFETGLGNWTNSTGFNFNWTRLSGSTASSSTGPSGAADGNFYVYTESSSPNYSGKTAAFEATFDFRGYSQVALQFAYHMHGNTIGSLSVDVFDGAWNSDVWTRSGQQQADETTAWGNASVDLSAYAGLDGVKVRFRGVTGSSFSGDIAVDLVRLFGRPTSLNLTYADWTQQEGLSEGNALPTTILHGDGLTNLIKYAFNLDASGPDFRYLVPEDGTSGLPVFLQDATGSPPVFRLEYLRRRSDDLTYSPLQSTTLADDSWIPAIGTSSTSEIDLTWERVTIEIPIPNPPAPLFFKVNVTLD